MDSKLQNKLQEFSALPPDGVWNKIADTLDATAPYPQRLLDYEETPPVINWTAIELKLAADVKPAQQAIPFTTRFKKPLRYAAAAAFIGVALVTFTLTGKRTEAGAVEPGSPTTVPTAKEGAKQPNVQQVAAAPVSSAENRQMPSTQDATTFTQTAVSARKPSSLADKIDPTEKLPVKTSYAAAGNYVFFRDGDGKLRKISRKLTSFIHCKDGDEDCKQRMQALRERLAAKAMTTDFTGILEMLHQLQ